MNQLLQDLNKMMQTDYIKPNILFLISCQINNQLYYLSNQSSIANTLQLRKDLQYYRIHHFLFRVEQHNQYMPIKMYQPMFIKHHYSNKYVVSTTQVGDTCEDGYKIGLSYQKQKWSSLPCFKYQTRNTQNIHFGERIIICEQNSHEDHPKCLFVPLKQQSQDLNLEILFGFYFKNQFTLIKYYQIDQHYFHYGQYLKVYHQQSYSFLVDSTPLTHIFNQQNNSKHSIVFQSQEENLGQSQLDCIWSIYQAKKIQGLLQIDGTMQFNSQIRLRNSLTQNCLTLLDNSTDDQNYQIIGFRQQTAYSVFLLQPVRNEGRRVGVDIQLRMKHNLIYQYMAVSAQRETHAFTQIIMDKIAQDQHFYEFVPVSEAESLLIYFLLSLKKQLSEIKQNLSSEVIQKWSLIRLVKIYRSLLEDLNILSRRQSNLQLLKHQLQHFIHLFAAIISKIQGIIKSKFIFDRELLLQVLKENYIILHKLVEGNDDNKAICFQFIHIYLHDIFKQLHAEQLLMEIFRNNIDLLFKVSESNQYLNNNIVDGIFQNIDCDIKDMKYWSKMEKIIDLFNVIVKLEHDYIDINQRLVAIKLFDQNILFDKLFFALRISKSHIYITHPSTNIEMRISNIKQAYYIKLVSKTISLLASLSADRNLISKRLIDSYLNINCENEQKSKVIINIFYIRFDESIRSQLLLLFLNLYVDSYPRIKRYRPLPIIKLNIESMMAQHSYANTQIAQLSNLLKQSIMFKAQRSHQSRPLSQLKNVYESERIQNKSEPSLNRNELKEYKKIVLLLFESQRWNIEILRIIRTLLNTEVLDERQRLNIFNKIILKIQYYSKQDTIMKQILLLMSDIFSHLQEKMLERAKIYFIIMHLSQRKTIIQQDIPYLCFTGDEHKLKKTSNPSIENARLKYNQISSQLTQYFIKNQLKSLLNIYLTNNYSTSIQLHFISNLLSILTPFKQSASLLFSASIVSQNDINQVNLLQDYSMQIYNLIKTSEEWLCLNNESNLYVKFIDLIGQLTAYAYEGYNIGSYESQNYRKKHKINKNRQIILRNIGVHHYLLQLLNNNYYLLQEQTLKTLSKFIRITFQKCFQFLIIFCCQSVENKEQLICQLPIINKYIRYVQVGQTQLWISLIRDNKKLIQEIPFKDIQNIIFKIVKDRHLKTYTLCDYNPLYIEQLFILIDINGKPYKPNIDNIAKILSQHLIFKKFLYLDVQDKQNEFCLQLHKLHIAPTQIPVIYQTKLLQLLIYLIKQLGSKNSLLRRYLKEIITLDYLFELLCLDDSFIYEGIPTDMNFMFKIEVLKLLQIYLSLGDAETQVYNSISLKKYLNYYKHALSYTSKRKQSMVDNQMLYYAYISKYQNIIEYYLLNTQFFYQKYLNKIFAKLHQFLQKIPQKQKNRNYITLSILLDKSRLPISRHQSWKGTIVRQRQVYIKWSNFTLMSASSSQHQLNCKSQLYQLLSHKTTFKQIENEKKYFFNIIQISQQLFLQKMISIIENIYKDSEMRDQQQLYKLLHIYYEFIEFKAKQQQNNFSIQKDKAKISSQYLRLIIPILKLLSLDQFDFNKNYCRKIYYYGISIINIILSFTLEFKKHQQILSFLQNNARNRFIIFNSLRISLIEMIHQQKIQTLIQQINITQTSLRLCTEQSKIQPLLPSLIFIKQLCRYHPFTDYLRNQTSVSNSIDFFTLIYTNLLTILTMKSEQLNIIMVERIQYLSECLISFFTNCNSKNQLLIVNRQFINEVQKLLKIDDLKLKRYDESQLQLIIDRISINYSNTIPQYKQIFIQQYQFLKFTHFQVINSIKVNLIKIILLSSISNQIAIQKLQSYISIELIKLNLIFLHQHISNISYDKAQSYFLQTFVDWRYVYENQDAINSTLTLPSYALSLIATLQGQVLEIQQEIEDEGEQKLSRYLPSNIKILLKQLKDEGYFKDILLFYQKYYEAQTYFKRNMINIEIVLSNKKLITILFPKLFIFSKFKQQYEQQIFYNCNRVNQQQKNKSLLILTSKIYQEISQEIKFNSILIQQIQYSSKLIQIFQHNQNYNIILCIINFIISFIYLFANYEVYSNTSPISSFSQEIFIFYQPIAITRAFLLIFQLINQLLCYTYITFLIIKKIPFYFYLHMKSFHKLQQSQKIGISKYQLTHGLNKLGKTIILDLFLAIFSLLSILHPIFSTIIILYIITRVQIGQIIMKMLRSLYFQLFIVLGILLVINYVYAIYIYVNFTQGTSYGAQCVSMYVCMKLFMDQLIKGGFVTLLPNNYVNLTISMQLISQISYNIFVMKILFQIFNGLFIDKIAYLRQKNSQIQKDEIIKCFICGQSQFQIDMNLQGFQKHLKISHNKNNYIFYLFYLRRKKAQKYVFYEDLIKNCIEKGDYSWIPFETSIEKQKIQINKIQKKSVKTKFIHSLQQKHLLFKKTLFNTIRVNKQIEQTFQNLQQKKRVVEQLYKDIAMMKFRFNNKNINQIKKK